MFISYKEIFKSAWQITTKNKILWFFGIFASFISLESAFEILLSQFNQQRQDSFLSGIANLYHDQIGFIYSQIIYLNLLAQDYLSYIFFILVMVIAFLFIWLVFTSQIFIIKSAAKLYRDKLLNMKNDLAGSNDNFWPVVGINILNKLFLYAGYLLLSLPLIYGIFSRNYLVIPASHIFFFFSFTVFAIVISFLTAYATNFIVLNNLSIIEAYSHAWKLFSKNVFISLEIAFLLFFLKIISLIIILSVIALVFVPIFFLLVLNVSNQNILGFVMSLTLIMVAVIFITLIGNAIFTTFYLASWTITFIQLTENTLIGKILSFLSSIPKLFQKASKKYGLNLDKAEIKKEARDLTRKTSSELMLAAKNLNKKYQHLQPKIAKQKQVMATYIKETYNKIEPRLEKEIDKIFAQKKKTTVNRSKNSRSNKSKTTK
jgi:hypothetical protein